MKQYIHYFKWIFIITAILGLVYGGIALTRGMHSYGERSNTESLTTERVFDYGDVLLDEEEDNLRKLIAKREKQTGCDIILVTLNESLKEYATQKEGNVPYSEFVRIYAEQFYDDNKFGYNKPIGDGVLLLDNWYREDDGRIYTWLCTTGRVKEEHGNELVDRVLDGVYNYVEYNPYRAYEAYINEFYQEMTGRGDLAGAIPFWVPLLIAGVSALIFIALHWSSKKGSRTTVPTTYVNDGRPKMRRKEDILVNKVVTKRHIPRNDSGGSRGSGGGGGRSYGGGGSHGGGGRSR
ncbi:TPM domain-containing protein [Kineothrix sp. MB12-C1]|uniref:TPM domain-containing protein n=1 Tax=Kineothrix sp. MB12-C1 TaxID=3070215 RepID=UPI0027D340AB|nr:TPM domain-containing protein [Kineothrix sp. MB12-C1]WMC93034.1 TPM domain-containing protein [Kineothrix sp. MB12-C1]